jgi:hypothetical protein
MSKHWTEYVANVSQKQAYALDKQADSNGCSNGLDWLARCNGVSSSKMTKIMSNAVAAKNAIDTAFKASK